MTAPTTADNSTQIERNERRAHSRVLIFGVAMLVAYAGIAACLFLTLIVSDKTDRNHKSGLVIRRLLANDNLLLVRIDAVERHIADLERKETTHAAP